jgi:tRNA pseudouridine38-40 synthase
VRLRLTLEYDGSGFHGWAAQPGLRTVESELRHALVSVYGLVDSLAVAGRTDAGVHALGQVASVEVDGGPPASRVAEALNAELPDDVSVVAAAEAPPDFHARHSARSRAYRYRIYRRSTPSPFEARRSWWVPKPIDVESLREAAAQLLGEHEFRAFTPTGTQHETFRRTVLHADWLERGEHLEFEIEADSFLRHMVRALVGSMVDLKPESIERLLDGADRSEAGRTAPPWGLYLERVSYPDVPRV